MTESNYKKILIPLLNKLALSHGDLSDIPQRIGLCFDSEIFVNIEFLAHFQDERIVLTGKVGPVMDFGSFYDVCALVAKGNFYLAKSNGCTLSVHEETQTIYVQYAIRIVTDELSLHQTVELLLENALVDIVECIKHVRSEGLH